MPQLDNVTFLSQIFWFIGFFLLFYQLLLQIVLPQIVTIFKARRKISQITHKRNFVLVANRPNNESFVRTLALYSLAILQANNFLGKSIAFFKNFNEVYNNFIRVQYLKQVNQKVFHSVANFTKVYGLLHSHYKTVFSSDSISTEANGSLKETPKLVEKTRTKKASLTKEKAAKSLTAKNAAENLNKTNVGDIEKARVEKKNKAKLEKALTKKATKEKQTPKTSIITDINNSRKEKRIKPKKAKVTLELAKVDEDTKKKKGKKK